MRGQYCKNGSSVSDSPRITRKLDIGRGQSEIRHPRNLPIIGLPTIRELFVHPAAVSRNESCRYGTKWNQLDSRVPHAWERFLPSPHPRHVARDFRPAVLDDESLNPLRMTRRVPSGP